VKQAARVISLIINPFIMPLLGIIFVFKIHAIYRIVYPSDFGNILILLACILTLIFPFISIYVLYRSGLVADLSLSNRKDRLLPSAITVAYYVGFYYFIHRIEGIDTPILAGFLGGCVALALSILITLKWKISLHAHGISSLAGMVIGVTQITFVSHHWLNIGLLIAIGLVGTSRLILHKHSALQVYAGAMLGFLGPYLFVINEWAL
jgi:hypothetical protein